MTTTTDVILMRYVPTLKDPIYVAVREDIQETGETAQVHSKKTFVNFIFFLIMVLITF